MADRIELQETLETILGSRNVYFQPPSNIRMSYPAIVYHRSKYDPVHAENSIYYLKKRYDLILIDGNPESEFVEKLIFLPYCTYDRNYVSENLYHHSFILYW